ncbi:superoxide dismutase [Devosia rhodophyticola]|uniref:Superoxide dismutase n=1 Tax=Devosia rhodophyticola TaxID=3026423 RepID=A0ABY7YYX2_9HYPH|nr:superoxide dismutase [Devosia rhodophyticola]WDR06439.1 superoxide dismutase [Devosia rhodophyticola]
MSTKFTLPELPYAYDALGPHMSAETLEFHHDKHHQAYVTNGEKLLEGSGLEVLALEDIVKEAFGKNAGLFNNAGQHYNHTHFWNWMKPNGGGKKLPGALQAAIDSDLGGFDKFRADFIAAGTTQFGSGWAWLSLKNGKLEVSKTANGESPLVHGGKPLLGVDVWEHSYYIDYRNARPKYLEAWFDNLVNWEHVELLFEEAR